jgi:hypothetical protein
MIRLIDAIINRRYRIYDIVGLEYKEMEKLRKRGFINDSNLILIERTSYGYYMVDVTHPNGNVIRCVLKNDVAEHIFLDTHELNANFVIVDIKDGK